MADSGGQPQLTQVSSPAIRGGTLVSLNYALCHTSHPHLPGPWAPAQLVTSPPCLPLLILLLQPGKLTEAFKYFLQGMGYSEYRLRGCCGDGITQGRGMATEGGPILGYFLHLLLSAKSSSLSPDPIWDSHTPP